MTDFEKQISFIMELDKIKKITRQTYLSDGSRKENDAEHSWHLALMAFVLADYANEPVDVLKTMKMVLLHDVIEIDAGDTYAYDTEGNKTKRERELKAADRIFGLLPEAQQKEYRRSLWDEFEAMETPESKFANMLADGPVRITAGPAVGRAPRRERGGCGEEITGVTVSEKKK